METLEKSRVCRLCGKHSGISIDIFDKNDNHVKKINAILPILVHEMDLLPKHMCHRCSYKLEEFHKFYIDCLKTDTALKSQLSWMRKDTPKERVGVPMVQIENVKIKSEPQEIDPLLESVGLVEFPVTGVESGLPDCIMYTSFANTSRCQYYYNKADPTRQAISKVCTNPQVHLRLNGANEPQEPEILWKRRNRFGSSKDSGKSLNQKKPSDPTFTENSLPKTETLSRNLRPRKRSVDYVGTKRKTSAPDSAENTEPTSNLPISNDLLLIKDELIEVEPLRTLRPRKQLGSETKESRSKSVDRCRKRVKSSNTKPGRSNSVAQETFELEIKREIVDGIENEGVERLDLRLKTEPEDSRAISSLRSKSVFKKRKDRLKITKVVQISEEVIGNDGLTIRKDGLNISKDGLNISKDGLNISKDGLIISKDGVKVNKDGVKVSKTGLIGKEDLKAGKLPIKKSSKVRFSPKNLRSQDLHLRSGKVKVMNALNIKHLRKDFRSGRNLPEKLNENIKAKAKLPNLEVKHLCEKCNFSFANKELFKLHACYSN